MSRVHSVVSVALLIGVVFSVGLHIYSSAMEVRVVELKSTGEGDFEEQSAPICPAKK